MRPCCAKYANPLDVTDANGDPLAVECGDCGKRACWRCASRRACLIYDDDWECDTRPDYIRCEGSDTRQGQVISKKPQ